MPGATYHFKPTTETISTEVIVDFGRAGATVSTDTGECPPFGLGNKVKNEANQDEEAGDVFETKASTLHHVSHNSHAENPEFPPGKLPKFPAELASDMHARFQWIVSAEAGTSMAQRFTQVYSCKYVHSTFHRHLSCWKNLVKLGTLEAVLPEKKWMDFYTGGTNNPIKIEDLDTPSSKRRPVENRKTEVIDLTRDE